MGTTVDIILRNGLLREGDTLVLCDGEGPFVVTVRALLMPQPLRELRVKNSYVSHAAVMAAQGVKVTAKGELERTLPGSRVLVTRRPDEVDVLKVTLGVKGSDGFNCCVFDDPYLVNSQWCACRRKPDAA